MKSDFKLSGKNILITGASSGFGRSIAISASEFGANVILTGRNEGRLHETRKLINGENHIILPYDLNEVDALDSFISQMPKLDGVVLCAGIQKIAPVRYVSNDIIEETMRVNTAAPILMAQRLLKKNLINRGGSFVFISSIASHYASFGNSIYAASKGALNAFSKCMALEVAPQGIRVNCVLPGTVRTGATDDNMISEEDRIKEERAYPLGKGSVEDIANGVIYLLSPASRWITGTVLTIDGGLTLN